MTVDVPRAAALAIGRSVASAEVTTRAEIAYDPFLAGRTVERVAGSARTVAGEEVPWSAVVKRTSGVDLRAARRELDAYRSGVAGAEPSTGLRAPKLLGWSDQDGIELWLEEVRDAHGGRWPVVRYGRAAAHIAAWDARRASLDLPGTFDAEDAWAERHGQPERVDDVLAEIAGMAGEPAARAVMEQLEDPGFQRLAALVTGTPARIERLERFAVSPLHHDLVRSNLFALDEDTTVAIDWENVGRGPLGVDLVPLVLGSVRRGEAAADDLLAIEEAVLAGYVRGLGATGEPRESDVRAAYHEAIGLRWHVVLGTVRAALDPSMWGMRGSRRDEPREEALRHLFALSRHILAAGDAG